MNQPKEIEIADIDESDEEEIQQKLNASKIQYPIWKGQKNGQVVSGYVKEVLTFPNTNGKDNHGVLINLQTKNKTYPIVSIWANTVILSGLKRLCEQQNFSNFDSLSQSLKTIETKTIAIRYEGEVPPSQKGFKPYQNYSIVEI